MVIIINFELFGRIGVVVVGGINGRRRANLIHHSHRKQSLGLGAGRKINPVEIRKGLKNRFYFVAVDLTVFDNLAVRVRIGYLGRPPVMA